MDYADIMKALPKEVADLLHSKLDKIQLTKDLSPDEAKELLDGAVKLTRLEMVIEDDEKRRLVDTLLSFVSQAGVSALFA